MSKKGCENLSLERNAAARATRQVFGLQLHTKSLSSCPARALFVLGVVGKGSQHSQVRKKFKKNTQTNKKKKNKESSLSRAPPFYSAPRHLLPKVYF